MKNRLVGFAAVLAIGCGGDVCSRTDSLVKSLNQKGSACANEKFEGKFDSCAQKLKACTADDQAKLGKWFDCIDALPACVAGQEQKFDDAFKGCATSNLAGVSQACFDSMVGA